MQISIDTKFNIGDEVYYVKRGNICSAIVNHLQAVFVKADKVYCNTTYRLKSTLEDDLLQEDFFESKLFATKEELLKHLGKDEQTIHGN